LSIAFKCGSGKEDHMQNALLDSIKNSFGQNAVEVRSYGDMNVEIQKLNFKQEKSNKVIVK
jgi:hypothetical protein